MQFPEIFDGSLNFPSLTKCVPIFRFSIALWDPQMAFVTLVRFCLQVGQSPAAAEFYDSLSTSQQPQDQQPTQHEEWMDTSAPPLADTNNGPQQQGAAPEMALAELVPGVTANDIDLIQKLANGEAGQELLEALSVSIFSQCPRYPQKVGARLYS